MNFIPLHIYSGYSILQSGLNFERIFNTTLKNKYPGIGLCDLHTMSGIPEFEDLAKKNNLRSIFGIDIEVTLLNERFLISIFALNEEGYRSLIKISSEVTKSNNINLNLKDYFKNLICVLPTITNNFELFMEDTRELFNFSNLFKDFYLGIENYSHDDDKKISSIRTFAKNHSYKTIAFPWIRYVKPSDAIVLEITDAIANEKILEINEKSGPYYFPSEETIKLNYTEEEISNTYELVSKVNFDFNQKRGHMLKFSNDNAYEILKKECFDELEKLNLKNNDYFNRLNYELEVINNMGYCDYFLIVADYVLFAKSNNILVGPGRGSAAGALVAFLLGITTVDPLKYDLLFERFLNKERVSMPDIDMDFEDIKRDQVVSYLVNKYGQERVSNIITFQTIGAKQSIRDIGRVYRYPSKIIDSLSKSIPDNKINLHDAYRYVPAFKELVDSDEYYLNYVKLASKIEGLPRQTSIHAAGIVLNNNPIIDEMPIINESNGLTICQYEMNHLENQGFLKMDILGLRNLTIIHKCLDLIKKYRNITLDYENLPYDTKETFNLIAKGYTAGVFQLESSGIKKAIEKLKPSSFNDVVALLALFRPGPMDQINLYAERKNYNKKIDYLVPELEPILKSTYGIIVYQEQIMQITQKVAGFSLAEADIFRRAISKKDVSKMTNLKDNFIKGCLNNGYNNTKAEALYDLIVKFANYGFNKSHSVSYAIITCQMAYLKYKYPYEFFISLLEIGSSSSDTKFQEYIREMKKLGINLLLPNINHSSYEYKFHEGGLIIPLTSIHGINNQFIEAIIGERNKNGEYKDIYEFALRLTPYGLNDQIFIKLIDSGALDLFDKSRASLRKNEPNILRYATIIAGTNPQEILLTNVALPRPRYEKVEDNELENFECEYEALGITISNTILTYKKDYLNNHGIRTIDYLIEHNYPNVPFACLLKSKKIIKTKKGEPMAFLKVFDENNELEVTLFPTVYAKSLMFLETNKVLIIKGNYQKSKDSFIADEINEFKESEE